MSNPVTVNIALLVARVVTGVVFLAHGIQKVATFGMAGTTASMEANGVPLPEVAAFLVTWVEIIGGVALILGAFTPVVAALLVVDMIGAVFFAHITNGIFVTNGGWELAGILGAISLIFAAIGAGAFSVDHVLGKKLRFLRSPLTSRDRELADAR